ncbi:MAG: hypothetical protein QNJ13_12510 [Paracoccaceae bacterium]|nr:hypothetical protein [Paracoccaceae bacterium]
MPWEGTRDQQKALWDALDQVLNEQGVPAQRLATAINTDKLAREALARWGDDRGKHAQIVDDGTLTRWHEGGVQAVERARQHKKAVIYEFFERTAQPRTLLYRPEEGWPHGLVNFAAQFGAQLRRPLAKDLSDLDGDYLIFRPAWTIRSMEHERVLISKLRISTTGGFTRYTEEQDFADPAATSISIKETDDGGVLYLGGNIVLIGLTRETQALKFYTAWSVFPVPGDGTPVNRMRGTMMGVVGAGPHAAYPFVAYRTDSSFEGMATGIVNANDAQIPPDVADELTKRMEP